MRILNKIKQNHMIDALINLKGNPKACILSEPLWYIPYNLYIPFATLFMLRLGVDDAKIGFLLTLGMILQVFASFFGGVITDKLGRRLTTLIFDMISWSLPCLIWALAQNFWWFLVATVLNSMWQITNNSWTCLLVEDCDKKTLVTAYSWIQICGLLAVFFAPISTFFVSKFDLVIVVRILYLFSFVSMTVKFIYLYWRCTETKQGKIRMEETRNTSISELIMGYKSVLIKLLKSKPMRMVMFVMISYNITNMITVNFFGIYTTQTLGIPQGFLAIFPMIRAAIMLLFMFTFQGKLNRLPFKPVMSAGYIMFILANFILLLSPQKNISILLIYTLIEAFSLILVVSRKDSMTAIFIDDKERSRVTGLLYMIMIGVSAPFGWIAGILSSIDRRLPFVFNIVVFAITLAIIITSKSVAKLDKEHVAANQVESVV